MPYAEKLPSGRWRAVWLLPDGRRKSKGGFIARSAARAYAQDQEETGPSPDLTWADWKPQWLAERRSARSSIDSDTGRIDKWLHSKWADVKLEEIDRHQVQLWVNFLDKQVAPGSVAKIYGLFSSSLSAALDAGLLKANPCSRIKLPDVPPGKERYFTFEEFDAVYAQLREPYAMSALTLVETGLRFGEFAGLHTQRINRATKLIDVVETLSEGVIEVYPKGRRRRGVPISDRLLQAWPQAFPARTSCGVEHASHGAACRSDLLTRGPHGGPMDDHNMLQRHWYPALKRAGVDPGTLHDLRHTYASWMIQAGISLDQLAALLGHSSVVVTQRYAHLGGTHLDQARAVLNARALTPRSPHAGRLTIVPSA